MKKDTLDIIKRVITEGSMTAVQSESLDIIDRALQRLMEGRGRPRKDGAATAEEDSADTHILMQLRKTITLRGAKPVKFHNGETYGIHPSHAYKALDKYAKMKNADDKEKFMHKLGHSRGSFFTAMQEEYEMIEESVDQSIHDHLTSKGFTKETSAGRVVYSHKKSGTHYSHSTLSHTWSQISKKRHDSGYVDIGKRQKIETIGNNDKMKQHLGIK